MLVDPVERLAQGVSRWAPTAATTSSATTSRWPAAPQLLAPTPQARIDVAYASTPAYFDVASRRRPLRPYPQQARYRGTGDINDAASFSGQRP